jgi:hypothetical protein
MGMGRVGAPAGRAGRGDPLCVLADAGMQPRHGGSGTGRARQHAVAPVQGGAGMVAAMVPWQGKGTWTAGELGGW